MTVSDKEFKRQHVAFLSRNQADRNRGPLTKKFSEEKFQRLQNQQKDIEKDSYDLTHSKGIFGLSISQAEEDAQVKSCLPEYEEFDDYKLCYDVDFSRSTLPLRQKTNLIK